jgi:hypothetical protein
VSGYADSERWDVHFKCEKMGLNPFDSRDQEKARQQLMREYKEQRDAQHQTPAAASGDHPGGDRADVARHDEVTE